MRLKAVSWVGLVFLPVTAVVTAVLINLSVVAGCITAAAAFVMLVVLGEPGFKLWQRALKGRAIQRTEMTHG